MGGAEVCISFTEVFPSAYRPAALPCNGKAIFPARGPRLKGHKKLIRARMASNCPSAPQACYNEKKPFCTADGMPVQNGKNGDAAR